MANIIKNEKLNNCLKGLKSCLKTVKNSDYEFVSYDQQQQPETNELKQQSPETQRNCIFIQQFKSKSTANIQCEPEQHHFELKKQRARSNLMQQFKTLSQTPQFHSTQIEQTANDDSMYFSALDLTNKQTKVSSTMINTTSSSFLTADLSTSQINDNETNGVFSNQTYLSPVAQRNLSTSSSTTEEDFYSQYQSYSFKSTEFKSVNSNFFLQSTENDIINNQTNDQEQLYVCCIPYDARVQGDLNLKFAERVKLIHSNNNGMSLVQNVSNKQCGYVPTISITLLASFLKQF